MAKIDRFEMERYQSLHWHEVEHDLSESGVSPAHHRELLGPYADAEIFMQTALGYPLSEGSAEARTDIAAWYPGADRRQRDRGQRRVRGQLPHPVVAPRSPATASPSWSRTTCRAWASGRFFGKRHRHVPAPSCGDGRWALDLESLERAVGPKTRRS